MRVWCSVVAVTTLVASAVAAGQTPATLPRTSGGQPDISGFWSERSGIEMYSIELGKVDPEEGPIKFKAIVDPPDGQLPYQPWAATQARTNSAQAAQPSTPGHLDPVARCFLEGVPRMLYQGGPPPASFMRILQTPAYIAILHETGHQYRVIHLDGRPSLGNTLKLWMGNSRGHWEGNTLVVDVSNHNDRTWFDQAGDFHSDSMRITERWTFASADRIDYTATIEDPKVYTRPWTLALTFGRNPPREQWENIMCEGNKYVHVVFGLPFD